MQNPFEITTIIPTFRRPKLLKKAIKSVLDQSYTNICVCVYDNASGDETRDVVAELMQRDSRIQYHAHQTNLGMIGNYQYAYSQIKTPFFSFLSDDDELSPWFYETAIAGFKKYPEAGISACAVTAYNEHDEFVALTLSSWPREGFYDSKSAFLELTSSACKLPIPTTVLFQTNQVKRTPPVWTKEAELRWDSDFIIQISSHSPIIINKKSCGRFLVHSNSYSGSLFESMNLTSKPTDIYMLATRSIIERISQLTHLDPELKEKAIHNLKNETRSQIYHFAFIQWKNKKFLSALKSIFNVQKHFGLDKHFYNLLKIKIKKKCPKYLLKILRSVCYAPKRIVPWTYQSYRKTRSSCPKPLKKIYRKYLCRENPTTTIPHESQE